MTNSYICLLCDIPIKKHNDESYSCRQCRNTSKYTVKIVSNFIELKTYLCFDYKIESVRLLTRSSAFNKIYKKNNKGVYNIVIETRETLPVFKESYGLEYIQNFLILQ